MLEPELERLIEAARRMGPDGSFVHMDGETHDGAALIIAVGIGPGAELLGRIIRENGVWDPRSESGYAEPTKNPA